jgi:hypothetical protein
MYDENDQRITYLSLAKAMDELAFDRQAVHLRGEWWISHPQRGLVLWDGYPQCNRDKQIATIVQSRLYPWAEVIRVALAIIPERRWREDE